MKIWKKSSSKSQSTQKRGYRRQVRPFLFQNSSFDLHSFAALWATRLHSTSFERSDSYLLGNSWKIGMTALLCTLFLLKVVLYILLYVGTEQIRHPWPFLGFWRGLGLWPQFFALNQQIYVVSTCCAKKFSHSIPYMLKITKPNYLKILLHQPVSACWDNLFQKNNYNLQGFIEALLNKAKWL